MTAAVQRVLNKSDIGFSKVKGLGCFMLRVGISPRREVPWWFVFPSYV